MEEARASRGRQANWDLLRGLSMFLVVVVHTAPLFPLQVTGFDLAGALSRVAIVCDPIFFMLSGFFALRPLRRSLREYYLKKVSSIVLPLVVYSVILYFYGAWSSPSPYGYFSFVVALLGGNWWFIPTLIPMLVVAPFFFRALEGLDDRWVLRLTGLLGILYGWGALSHILTYFAAQTGHATVGNVISMMVYYVPIEFPGGGYLPVFLMGYLVRRLFPILTARQKRGLAGAGLAAWALTFLLRGFGVPASDPNQVWVFAAFGSFFLFEDVRVPDGLLSRAVTWIGKRAYSIYLLQFTTISIFTGLLYGDASPIGAALTGTVVQVAVWCVFVVASFLLALFIASILDPLVLGNVQRIFKMATSRWLAKPGREE